MARNKINSILSVALVIGSLTAPATESAGAAVSGRLKAWGFNSDGELGNGNTDDQLTPVNVPGLTRIKQVSGGCDHTLAVKRDGSVRAWGDNDNGELGNDDAPNDSHDPIVVSGLDNVKAVAAGCDSSFALKNNGTVRAWGYNFDGELGNDDAPNDSHVPITVPGLNNVKQLAASYYTALALKEDGTVWAWGKNTEGEMGNGTTDPSAVPVKVPGLGNVKQIGAYPDGFHVLVIKGNGSVWAWGANTFGQLGDGTYDTLHVPVRVAVINHVKAVAAGYQHSLALLENGQVWAWGANDSGQVGDDTVVTKPTPVPVEHLKGVKAITTSEDSSLALKKDGTVRAWGSNSSGQLGIDSNDSKHLPVKVHNLSNVAQIAGGYDFCFAVLN